MASNAIIQYTSSSSSHSMNTYDVFVSFRGEDTRHNFTGFLFEALRRKGIHAFKDDEDLKKGESIAPELLQAIQGSRLFITVFSKNYASSTWCLRELTEICNCVKIFPRRVIIPIFYDVDPSVVRKQSGCYEKAFEEHEERLREDEEKMEEVERWRKALTHVANLAGWDVRDKSQYIQIEEIVQNIINILGPKISTLPKDELVGIESRVEELTNLLCLDSDNEVRVIGISGMGGIGKTTLTRTLYERISQQYNIHCFIDDVSKIYQHSSSLGVQKQLLSQSLNEKNLEICNAFEGTYLVWNRLHNARALVVLDNVDQVEQLRMFTGNRDTLLRECLGGGSRIIIISRDEHILRTYGVDDVYQVQPLKEENAIQLFCRNAFKVNYILSDYEKLAHEVLLHARGHPLAIEVIGSSLFGRNVSQWKSALTRLKNNSNPKIMDVLRISFDQLDEIDKEIFLDIACFFDFYSEKYVKEILNFRGFHAEYGIQVLIDKSLITIEGDYISIHSLLIDLGRSIVREKSPKKPIKWSRIWDYQDLHNALLDNQAAENLEVVWLRFEAFEAPKINETAIKGEALSKFKHLKLLKISNENISENLNYLSNELGYLIWNMYPFQCLPPSFLPDKLVELNLCRSNVQRLWEGTKPLHNLKRLDLSYSKNLVEMPDLRDALNLERLNLEKCIQLIEINPSIGLLRKLVVLNLKGCKNLVFLPKSILGLNSIEYLNLSGCSKLYKNQLLVESRDTMHLNKLWLVEDLIHSQSTSSFIKKWLLRPLDLFFSAQRDSSSYLLHSSPTLSALRELDLSFCNLLQISEAIGKLHFLEKLNLKGNNFATLPSLKNLFKLYNLNLQHCKRLKYLPDLPSRTDMPSKAASTVYIYEPFLSDDEVDAGLFIYNCPELVDSERCTSMTTSWMIQIAKAKPKNKYSIFPEVYLRIGSIIPGSEIPRWFNNEHVSMDNSIIIDAPPITHDNNWIGVVCCAIFQLREMSYQKTPFPCFIIPVDARRDLVIYNSDHMCLLYFTQQDFINGLKLEMSIWCFRTSSSDMMIERSLCPVEMKKYGYRWVSEQDLELSNSPLMQCGNLTTRKRKFLAMEENR